MYRRWIQIAGNTATSRQSLQRAAISKARWRAEDYGARMNAIQTYKHVDVQSSVQLPELPFDDSADRYDESRDALGAARAILLAMVIGSGLWAMILWLIF